MSFEYRDDSCCPAENVLAANEIRAQQWSKYMHSIVSLWEERYGKEAWHQEEVGQLAFKHFTVYFDDAGCLDVVSAQCLIDSEGEAGQESVGGR